MYNQMKKYSNKCQEIFHNMISVIKYDIIVLTRIKKNNRLKKGTKQKDHLHWRFTNSI